MGSRLKIAHTTLTHMNWRMVQSVGDPAAGGKVRTRVYATAPRSSPKSGPATERTNCCPGFGRSGNCGKVTPPKACKWISGCPPKARPTSACPSSWTSTLKKTTKIHAAIFQPKP